MSEHIPGAAGLSQHEQYIAIDIGGTQLRAALYGPDGHTPLQVAKTPTQGAGQSPIDRLMALVAGLWPAEGAVAAIAAAAPGPVDPYAGVVLSAPNIPGWDDLPLRRLLEERFGVPAALGNDANLAALGEWQYGAGKGHHNLLYLTVSTGIGGGVILNDQLLLGERGMAAELGHVTIVCDGPPCGCGQRGHLESVASGTAIARWVAEEIARGAPTSLPAGQPVSGKLIAEAARTGDPLAVAALHRAGTFLGIGIANYLHIFNPSIVVIGGGFSRSGPLLFAALWAALRSHVMTPHYLDNLTLAHAELGDNVGLVGALALARSLRPR